ncbi:class I SAM-dependent DNA methyltransferase [Hydrogenimonas sp.]
MSFDKKAQSWDASSRRQQLAEAVAESIKESFKLQPGMSLLDVGAGTGLLARRLLPYVAEITGVDSSEGMLHEFSKIGGAVKAVHSDILTYDTAARYDGIVSSMTMHHIQDIDALFCKLFSLLKPGGFIAIADLATEDGTFHEHGNEGVCHFGFDELQLQHAARGAGFTDTAHRCIHTVEKENGRCYDIFLFTALKPRSR